MKDLVLCIPTSNAHILNLNEVLKLKGKFQSIILVLDGVYPFDLENVKDSIFKIIWHKENKGLAAARNVGVFNCDAEFIAFLDADCVPGEGWPEVLLKYFDDPQVAAVGAKVVEVHTRERPDFWRAIHMAQHWGEKVIVNPPYLFGANTVFKKEALLDVGLYDEKYKTNFEDVDISRRLKKKKWKLIYTPEAKVYHLKKDDLKSLLLTFWRWNFHYYEEKNYYQDITSISAKLDENFGRANIFLQEDLKANRYRLFYIDFLLPFVLCLLDFCYMYDRCSVKDIYITPDKIAVFLSLLEFIFHNRMQNISFSTFIAEGYAKEQNLILYLLLIGKVMKEKSEDVCKKVINDLCHIFLNDRYWSNIIFRQIQNNYNWATFVDSGYGYLFSDWLTKFLEKSRKFLSWIGKDKIIEILEAGCG